MKLCILITTKNNYDAIDYWLYINSELLKKYSVDLVVYNYGNNDSTNAVVSNFIIEGNTNLKCISIDTIENTDPRLYFYSINSCKKNYDYIWLCSEYYLVTELAIRNVIEGIQKGYKIIYLNQRNEYKCEVYSTLQKYHQLYLPPYTEGSIVLSSSILENSSDKEMLDKYSVLWPFFFFINTNLDKKVIAFWGNMFSTNLKVPIIDNTNTIEFWTMHYYDALMSIENIDEKDKLQLLSEIVKKKRIFDMGNLLYLRQSDNLNKSTVKKNAETITKISSTPISYILMISKTPKSVIKYLINRPDTSLAIIIKGAYYVHTGYVPGEEDYN